MNKILQLADKKIHIQWINYNYLNESKPVLIFLHEALGSIIQWKSFPAELCEQTKSCGIIIERSGHGQSSPLLKKRNQNYLHEYAEETIEVLNLILSQNQAYSLIGHSDGGTIALLIGKDNPSNLKSIITLAAHTFVEPETLVGIEPAVTAFEAGKLDGLFRIHGEKTSDLFYAWANTWKADFFKNWDIRSEILTCEKPIYALQGTNDQYGTVEQLNSIKKCSDQVIMEEIPNCGHIPHIEKKEIVCLKISKWLNSLQ
jgi:pimeloyl-ACP methyl ester carboxylesterase